MAISSVDICNDALIDIGATTILDLSESTKAAKLCNLIFNNCVDFVLRAHVWKFATTRVTLSPLVSVPAFGYSAQFQLPADCLRVLLLVDLTDFRTESNMILCNETSIQLKYIRRITDVTQFDPMFVQALSAYIGFKISYAMMESAKVKEGMFKQYEVLLRKAKFVDATQNPSDELIDDTWFRARIVGSNTGVANANANVSVGSTIP